MFLILIFIAGFTSVAHAEAPVLDEWELGFIDESMKEVSSASPAAGECDSEFIGPRRSCSALTDAFCAKLAVQRNLTDLKTGQFLTGKTPKKGMTYKKKMDLDALIGAMNRLDPIQFRDLKEALQPHLKKLSEHLSREDSSSRWSRTLEGIEKAIHDAVEDCAEERTKKRFPKDDAPSNEKQNDLADLKNAILDAKYRSDPNWHRVERVFERVKADMLFEISKLSISEEARKRILERIQTVRVSLPYNDSRKLKTWEECGTTDDNAAYFFPEHVLVVCAGRFNTRQSEDLLYVTLAHEISHSFDPYRLAQDVFFEGPAGEVIKKFCWAKGPAYSCEEWERIKRGVLSIPQYHPKTYAPWRGLSSCLKSEGKLRSMDEAIFRVASIASAADTIHGMAVSEKFTQIANPLSIDDEGKVGPNRLFLRPDLQRIENEQSPERSADPLSCGFSVQGEIFTQELSCNGFKDASPEKRALHFDAAIDMTKAAYRALYGKLFNICGKECADSNLIRAGVALETGEDFSDWMARQIYVRELAREPSLVNRRERVAAAVSGYCRKDRSEQIAEDLARKEARYSFEEHPDSRKRRLSIFTREVTRLVGCLEDSDTLRSVGRCKLKDFERK